MENLRIVRGNDFYLTVPIRRIFLTTDEYSNDVVLQERMYLNECSVLGVRLIGEDERGQSLPFVVSPDDESQLIVKVLGCNLECGWYGLEVTGTMGGRRFRSYERKVFKTVENNGRSFVSGSMFAGEASYQVETMWTLYSCPSYPHFRLDLTNMTLIQEGTVENGEMYLDENGKLCMRVRD